MTQSFGILATFSNILGEAVKKIQVTPTLDDITITVTTTKDTVHLFIKTSHGWHHESPDHNRIPITNCDTVETLVFITRDIVCSGLYL